ncbi:PrsW family intramembrane metalloprotease, partial [Streptomyces anulatus]|nr:PrsW family intramembrane metalloprotease [Streptomyces anulatus]
WQPDRTRGRAAARAVAEYESFATSLAGLRRRARHGAVGPDFGARERELLHHLWQRREVAAPALTHAALLTTRPVTHHGHPLPPPYGTGTGTGYGHPNGYGYGYGTGPGPGPTPGYGQTHDRTPGYRPTPGHGPTPGHAPGA